MTNCHQWRVIKKVEHIRVMNLLAYNSEIYMIVQVKWQDAHRLIRLLSTADFSKLAFCPNTGNIASIIIKS